MPFARTSLPFAALLIASSAMAQPLMRGCLVLHDGEPPRPQPLTPGQRTLIAETIARSDTFDILHYGIDMDVTDYAGQSIKAATTITFQALMADQGSIRFDLQGLQVDSVIGPDGPLAFTHDGQFLRVNLETAPPVGEEQQLTVHYQGSPLRDPEWGGFYFASNYIYNLGIGLSTVPPNFGKVWYPCFDSFVERASYTWSVKSAGGRRLQGQGEFLGETQLGGDTVVRSFALEHEIPTHVSAIAVADYAEHAFVHTGAYGEIPVTLRAKPAQLNAMVGRFGDLGACIDALEHWYGPYAYGRVGYVLTTDGALEIPTNIAYPDFMPSQSVARNRKLFAHELGHHWWGDWVTPFVHNDMWLKEGPAEYSAHLLEEWLNGRPAMVSMVKDNLLDILGSAHTDDDGFQALSPMPDEHIYGTHTYYKGAAVMHNLRGYLGDDLFRTAMRESQVRLSNRTITPEQWRDTLESITGRDLHPFFQDWVFSPGYSVFEVRSFTSQSDGGGWTVDLHIGQKLYGTETLHSDVPLDLTLVGSDGQVHEVPVTASGASTLLQLSVPFQPVMAVLDRHHRLNQARMDHEATLLPAASYNTALPRVDFRLIASDLPDTALVRVEHIWSGADQEPFGPGVQQVSGTHYWNVSGRFEETAAMRARFIYQGGIPSQFDFDLVAGDESGMVMVWRPDADQPWVIHPDQTVTTGSLTNGTGQIELNMLLRGQIAFAKASGFIGMAEAEQGAFTLYPVPVADRLTVEVPAGRKGTCLVDILDSQGRLVLRQTRALGTGPFGVDVQDLPPGSYLLGLTGPDGRTIGAKRFVVDR
ncbi:MAG: M1 family aminopeptidase [Flavobacteriales bacterium]|nr:MAG: M1 family aminopeptidase [Flavobacteriales bacterium]